MWSSYRVSQANRYSYQAHIYYPYDLYSILPPCQTTSTTGPMNKRARRSGLAKRLRLSKVSSLGGLYTCQTRNLTNRDTSWGLPMSREGRVLSPKAHCKLCTKGPRCDCHQSRLDHDSGGPRCPGTDMCGMPGAVSVSTFYFKGQMKSHQWCVGIPGRPIGLQYGHFLSLTDID